MHAVVSTVSIELYVGGDDPDDTVNCSKIEGFDKQEGVAVVRLIQVGCRHFWGPDPLCFALEPDHRGGDRLERQVNVGLESMILYSFIGKVG